MSTLLRCQPCQPMRSGCCKCSRADQAFKSGRANLAMHDCANQSSNELQYSREACMIRYWVYLCLQLQLVLSLIMSANVMRHCTDSDKWLELVCQWHDCHLIQSCHKAMLELLLNLQFSSERPCRSNVQIRSQPAPPPATNPRVSVSF